MELWSQEALICLSAFYAEEGEIFTPDPSIADCQINEYLLSLKNFWFDYTEFVRLLHQLLKRSCRHASDALLEMHMTQPWFYDAVWDMVTYKDTDVFGLWILLKFLHPDHLTLFLNWFKCIMHVETCVKYVNEFLSRMKHDPNFVYENESPEKVYRVLVYKFLLFK